MKLSSQKKIHCFKCFHAYKCKAEDTVKFTNKAVTEFAVT